MDSGRCTFTDGRGRTWRLKVTNGALREIRDRLGFNLADTSVNEAGEIEALLTLSHDPILLVDTLFLVADRTEGNPKVGADEFAELIQGDVIDDATLALVVALCEYFPSRIRLVMEPSILLMRKMMAMTREAMQSQTTQTDAGAGSGESTASGRV